MVNSIHASSRFMLHATIDFLKAFDSVWYPTLFHKLILAGLAFLLTLLVGHDLSSLIGAFVLLIKTIKIASFESVEVFCKDSFLTLHFSFCSSMIFLLLCLLPSAVLFVLTAWPFGPPLPRSLLRWRWEGYTKSSDSTGALL